MKVSTLLIFLSMLAVSVHADYQLEIRLQSYANPGGRTSDMTCCEPEAEIRGMCLIQATCDNEFSFRIENFSRLRGIGQQIVLGVFEDMDSIVFPSCGVITGERENPLVFTFPTSAFDATAGDTARVIIDIADVDIDPRTRVKTTDTIATNVLFEIFQLQGTNADFRDVVLGGASLVNLQLRLQYRLICTPGSCGPDCSQTIECSSFPPACLPDQPDCDDSRPCENGGNCQIGSCVCPSGFAGPTCGTVLPPQTTTRPTVPTVPTGPTAAPPTGPTTVPPTGLTQPTRPTKPPGTGGIGTKPTGSSTDDIIGGTSSQAGVFSRSKVTNVLFFVLLFVFTFLT